jgi:hypothetical protein
VGLGEVTDYECPVMVLVELRSPVGSGWGDSRCCKLDVEQRETRELQGMKKGSWGSRTVGRVETEGRQAKRADPGQEVAGSVLGDSLWVV